MANAEVDTEELVEKYRRVLAKIDGVTQTVLSGHFEIETHLDDVLALVFPRHQVLASLRLSFVQKATMVRAAMQHEENRLGWPLIFAFNRLRNEIAHARKSEKQAALINDLRTRLNGCVAEGEENPAARDNEKEIIVATAAICSKFILGCKQTLTKAKLGVSEL
jgi:hypothetical protein